MKKLLILLVAFSVNANAQLIGITMSQLNRPTVPVPEIDNSFQDEKDYFSAYLLPVSEKANLQSALDTYGSVRLEAGDYSGSPITMTSNMKLYGGRGIMNDLQVPSITIASGSSNILINGVKPDGNITFQAGSEISNVTLKNIYYTSLVTTNGLINNCTFINLDHVAINFNCHTSGYVRNTRVIKQWVQGGSPQVVLKGNSTTPSYGNIQSFIIYQTSNGNVSDIDNFGDLKYIGIDSEAWGYETSTTEAMLKMTNMGRVVLADLGGGNGASAYKTPAFDIEGDDVFIFARSIQNASTTNDQVDGNLFLIKSDDEPIDVTGGYNFRSHLNGTAVNYNGSNIVSAISYETTLSNLTSTILGTEYTPIPNYDYPELPNPTGINWEEERIGKTDSYDYIQGLIDNNGIAQLDEGIYYIGSTLVVNPNKGIIGAGTGKTAIVGLTDDFPLISAKGTGDVKQFVFSNMTLQGGSTGIRINKTTSGTYQLSGNNWNNLIFRNQNYGIHIDRIFGMDTNVIDNVAFVDCNIGLFSDSNPDYAGGETEDMSYVDKLMFYRCQFINNNIGVSLIGTRSHNLNAFQDCLFDGNETAAILTNNNSPIFSNCDFRNHDGDYVVKGGSPTSFYSCNFNDNETDGVFQLIGVNAEGCNFNDDIPLMGDVEFNPQSAYIMNSTIVGDKGNLDNGVLVNSTFASNPTLSKLLVNVVSGTATTIIDAAPDPYPQYLVKH